MAQFTRAIQSIPTFTDYRRYKPYLRIDFRRRCAYCEMTEGALLSATAFGVDHFRPRRSFPQLECTYTNLYYCCNDCNRYKGSMWPPESCVSEGYFFPDPCNCNPQVEHLNEDKDGHVVPITNAGRFSLEVLRLNRETCVRFRRRRMRTRNRILECRKQLRSVAAPFELRALLERILRELELEYEEYYYDAAEDQWLK
jgi:5-methylcytosine-specific restriction endonuclease McrA